MQSGYTCSWDALGEYRRIEWDINENLQEIINWKDNSDKDREYNKMEGFILYQKNIISKGLILVE